jgi:hypothetical protein
MESSDVLTTTGLLAAAQGALLEAGYKLVDVAGQPSLYDRARLLQNQYSVVMVATFETWESLVESWADYQSETVESMSKFLKRGEAKASDGYLVLLTPSPVPIGEMAYANKIRSDTSRLRKLLGTADDLRTISDVPKVIAPLLPLSVHPGDGSGDSGLDALPRILEHHDIEPAATRVVIDAFKANAPIMLRLHQFKNPQ